MTSATLELQRYQSLAATYSLFDVSTDPVTLNNNTGTSATIFEDLGTGTSYGSFVVAGAGLPTDVLSFALNAAALADIAGAAGGFFSIGGSVAPGSNALFGASSGLGIQRLVLTVEPNGLPEPSTLAILAVPLVALKATRPRRSSSPPFG